MDIRKNAFDKKSPYIRNSIFGVLYRIYNYLPNFNSWGCDWGSLIELLHDKLSDFGQRRLDKIQLHRHSCYTRSSEVGGSSLLPLGL